MTQVDLAAVVALHRERKAKATIVLTPVENPTAYGLVETDAAGNVSRFLEKPKPEEITCNTINAGHLRPRARHLRPDPEGHRLVDRAQLLPVARRARRDLRRVRLRRLLDRHRHAREVRAGAPRHHGPPLSSRRPSRGRRTATGWCRPTPAWRTARSSRVRASSTRAPSSRPARGSRRTRCIGRQCHRGRGRADRRRRSSGPTPGSAATPSVRQSILGRNCHVGRNSMLDGGIVLGDKSLVTDYSKL